MKTFLSLRKENLFTKQTLRIGGIFLFLLIVLSSCRPADKSMVGALASGSPAPDFSLPDMNQKTVNLKQLRGHVVLLDFFATWCPPCRSEIPSLVDFYNREQGKGITIVGIALDEEGPKAVKPFVQEYKITYPVVIGNEKIIQAYGGIQGIPTKFLIDRKGNVVETLIGAQDIPNLEKKIKSL